MEWKFRHIYRGDLVEQLKLGFCLISKLWIIEANCCFIGQPRRHLLTTGWSVFVSQKNLTSGDAVLFLRYFLMALYAFVLGFGSVNKNNRVLVSR